VVNPLKRKRDTEVAATMGKRTGKNSLGNSHRVTSWKGKRKALSKDTKERRRERQRCSTSSTLSALLRLLLLSFHFS